MKLSHPFLLVWILLIPTVTNAAGGISFAITPTIFDMAAVPGQAWTTAIKVVNNNPYALTVYAEPANFRPQGEFGHGEFIPLTNSDQAGATLAEWMEVASTPFEVPPESSLSIPVSIAVPATAAPGGHYAAIMIGTRPLAEDGSTAVKTSQIITSLFFVRVAGDVVEQGEVRTFSVSSAVAASPAMTFTVRFQNEGNVHLQPRGEIEIKNMWGKERGIIPINNESNFGNVLPDSIRQFDVTWKGEESLLDIGRYTATLTLGYGTEAQQFVSRQVAFWVIPLKPLLVVLLVLLATTWLIVYSVRTYVRYMLRLSGIDPTLPIDNRGRLRPLTQSGDVRVERVALHTPVVTGYRDLRTRLIGVRGWLPSFQVTANFVRAYPRFFLGLLGFVILTALSVWYLLEVHTEQRDYLITTGVGSEAKSISSEEIIHERSSNQEPPTLTASTTSENETQPFQLVVVNAGHTPGLGGQVADRLTAVSYRVDTLTADLENERAASVIVYPPTLETEALALSEELGGLLLSAYTADATSTPTITIYLGTNYRLSQ